MKSYIVHHLAEFGWAIDVYENGSARARATGYASAEEAATVLVSIVQRAGL